MATEDGAKFASKPRPALAALLLATALTCFLAWLLKAECSFDGVWSNLEFYQKGCYSDAYPFWRGKGLDQGLIPYLDTNIEYPVLTGLLIAIEQVVALAMYRDAGDPTFVFVVTLFNTGLAMLVMRMLWSLDLPPGRLWAWACSPLLFLYAGHNWDLLAVALALAAFLAAERGRLGAAVALAALGAAAKLFPVVLLPLFALRRFLSGQVLGAFALAAIAIAVWVAVNLPVFLAAPDNWWEFYLFSTSRGGTAAASWDLLAHYGVLATDIPLRNTLSALAFAAGMVLIVTLGWRQYRDRLWWLAGPVIVWFLLTSKVYSPQFDIWPWPFLLIAARRWQPLALFALGDWCAYWAELWYFSGQEGGWPAVGMDWVALAAVIRAGAGLWLIADTLRFGGDEVDQKPARSMPAEV